MTGLAAVGVDDLFGNPVAQCLGYFEIKSGLQIQPRLRIAPKEAR